MLRRFIRKESTTIDSNAVLDALAAITDPVSSLALPDAGLIERIDTKEGHATIVLRIAPETAPARGMLVETCQAHLASALGITATVILTAHKPAPQLTAETATGKKAERKSATWNLTPISNVHRIIAVASGKGGVGKSTTTVQLAHALTVKGLSVGIVDADIYGPSLPRMLGLETCGQPAIEDGQMVPLVAYSIQAMSMGFIMGDSAAVMRAPMITKALHQLLRGTKWGEDKNPLDILLVDMPPGTGDIHISLAQSVPLSGAVIVTTPQDVAVMDAKKCAVAFEKLGVPVLGVIENMSGFTDSAGTHHAIFGEGGGKALAEEIGCKFLGEIPLNPALCTAMESGARDDACTIYYAAMADALSDF